MSLNQTKKEYYERRIARKNEELAALEEDLDIAKSSEEKLRIERAIEKKLTDIDELNSKLTQKESNSSQNNVKDRSLESLLQKIDCDEAKEMAYNLRQKLNSCGGGCSLLFLQKSKSLNGQSCTQEMIAQITQIQSADISEKESYGSKIVDFDNFAFQPNEINFLRLFAQSLGVEEAPERDDTVNSICTTIKASLSLGSTLVIYVKGLDVLMDVEEGVGKFLRWLIQDFWNNLVVKIEPKARETKSKIIVFLMAEGEICNSSNSPYFRGEEPFESCVVENVPLRIWTEEDIINWGIDVGIKQLPQLSFSTMPEVQSWARTICRGSDGIPAVISSTLRDRLS